METYIKSLEKKELAEATNIFVEAFRNVGEEWKYEIAYKHIEKDYSPEFCLGAFKEDKMVGFIAAKEDYIQDHIEIFIDIFAVLPKYQNKKIGSLLYSRIEGLANERGIQSIWLLANPTLPSYKFYENNGFKKDSWIVISKKL